VRRARRGDCVGRRVTGMPEPAPAAVRLDAERDRAALYFEVAGTMLVVLAPDGTVQRINRCGLELLGYDEEREVIGRDWYADFLPDDDVRARVREKLGALLARHPAGRPPVASSEESPVRRRDGSRRTILWRNAVLRDESGQGLATISSGEDVTDRRIAIEALRANERFTRRVIDNLYAFVGVLSLDGTLLEANRAPLEAAGIATSDVVGRKFWDCHWWSHSTREQQRLRDAFERALRGEVVRYDVQVRMAGNALMWIDFQLAPLRDDGGRITHLIPSAMDLTARKLAEARLEESERRWRGTFENAAVGVAHVALDGCFIGVNDRFCAITGYDRARLLRTRFADITHPDDVESDWAQARALARGDIERFAMEKRYLRPDATIVWVNLSAALQRHADGTPAYYIAVVEDISERRRAAERVAELARERERLLEAERAARTEAEAADRLKDEFLATLSHELRTPLANVVSWARLLQRKYRGPDEQHRRGLDIIVENAMAQSRLIDDLLDMSRIVRGQVSIEARPLDLDAFLEQGVAAHLPTAQAAGLALTLESVLTGDSVVLAEPARLQQVLGNLLSNAIKFTARGGRIDVVAREDGDDCEIRVRDTGEGIAADVLPHVFDRFRQADSSIGRRHGGLGLGLAIVRQLVLAHGGSVAAASAGPGRGATFTVRLPKAAAAASASGGARSAPSDAAPACAEPLVHDCLRGLRLMVVEDEPAMREHLRTVLAEQGADVLPFASAVDALRLLRDHGHAVPVDVLVSDLGMPELDGLRFIRSVRAELGIAADRLPAVAVTALAREQDHERALRAGYQRCIGKPYDAARLVATVRQLSRAPSPPS
jgi:PAS domain S-box-containing protein